MPAGTSKETLRKTATLVKSQLKVSKAKLHAKIKSIDGLEKVLPRNFRKPTSGEELILEQHSVLYLAYACMVAIAAAVFVGQWTYYGGLKEAITDITDDSSSGGYDSCKALQGDPIYNVKWTYETCKEKEESGDGLYAKLSNATSIVELWTWGDSGWGYRYFPFATSSQEFLTSCEEGKSLELTITNTQSTIISLSATFNKEASCSGPSLQYLDGSKCLVYYQKAAGLGVTYHFVHPRYVLIPFADVSNGNQTISWYQNTLTQNGLTTGQQIDIPSEERCVAYEKECVARAYEYLISRSEACHPCYTLKENSPFLCTTSKGKTVLEILSLSVSNTLAVFSFLVALVPMILSSFANRLSTIRVSKEEGDDGGGDDEDDSV